VVAPLLDDDLGFLEAVEYFPVEELVAQLAVELVCPFESGPSPELGLERI
jgi:hypothetical protein